MDVHILLWPIDEPDVTHVCPFSSGRDLPELTVCGGHSGSNTALHSVGSRPYPDIGSMIKQAEHLPMSLDLSVLPQLPRPVHLQRQWWQVLPWPQAHKHPFLLPNCPERNGQKLRPSSVAFRQSPLEAPHTENPNADSPQRQSTFLERYAPATLRTTLTTRFCVPSWPPHSLCSGSSLQYTQHY